MQTVACMKISAKGIRFVRVLGVGDYGSVGEAHMEMVRLKAFTGRSFFVMPVEAVLPNEDCGPGEEWACK